MLFNNGYIEYITDDEKDKYIKQNHKCECDWDDDYDCDGCYLAKNLSLMEDAPAYFRYVSYFEYYWHPTSLSLSELLEDESYLSCVKIIDSSDASDE